MKRMLLVALTLMSLFSSAVSANIRHGRCPEPLRLPADGLTITPGVLRVATSIPAGGFEFIDPTTGRPDGYDIRVACLFANCIGARLEIVNTVFEEIIPAVRNGAYDLGLADISITPGRLAIVEQVSYVATSAATAGQVTFPLFFSGNSYPAGVTTGTADHLAQLNASPVANKNVAVQSGTIQEQIVDAEIAGGLTNLTKVAFLTIEEIQLALDNGDVIAFLASEPTDVNTELAPINQTVPAEFESIVEVGAVIRRDNCALINAFENFVQQNTAALVALGRQFIPEFITQDTIPVLVPQVCTLTEGNPCRFANCPFALAISNKFCAVSGVCPFNYVELVPAT